MKNFKNKKTLQIVLLVLIAVVTLGIGYAAICAVHLIINGNATASVNQNNFKVHFIQAQAISGSTGASGTSTIDSQDDTKATFDVTGLTKVGDYAEAVYTVRNDSNGIGAEITLNLTSSNTEYFKVTETILDNKLQAGEETTAKVKVEMIKTPITDSVSTSITATLTASPLENETATGGDEKELVKPISYIYSLTTNNLNNEITGTTYPNFNAAKTAFGHPASIAHILEGGLIKESYVAFERNGEVYYLRGGAGNEFGQASMPVYDANVAELKKAFGPTWSDYCSEGVGGGYRGFSCDAGGLCAGAYAYGYVYVSGDGWSCYVYDDGDSYCDSW